jgi:hypothetical protein
MPMRLSSLRACRALLQDYFGAHFRYRLRQSQGHNAAGRTL